MNQSEKQLIKAVGVMLWLNNALDDIKTDPNLKYIVKQDFKMLLNRLNVKLEEQLNVLLKGAEIEAHEQAQSIYNLIDDLLLVNE